MDARVTSIALASFGDRLRRSRVAAGMSQEELARRSGLSAAGVGALERSTRRAPKRETLAMLENALALDERQRAELEQAAERGRARSRTPGPDAFATAHNLPLQLTTFVGRADQVEHIARLVQGNRLVSVLGSGGVGKTRAALEVAMRQAVCDREEVRFVDLAPLQDGSFLVGRIASVLGVRLPAANETAESLASVLKARQLLLLLDGCEHIIAEATETARILLQHCPQVKILTTTRERLGMMGEVVFRLPPLAVPDDNVATIGNARCYGALELFMQRALTADADLTITDADTQVLIDVCRRVEGIPLALELAAAQVSTLGLNTLSRRLEATLGASRDVRGRPDRQRTMRDTIAWSYRLLSEPERSLLRCMSVFAGGCTLSAAESVCPTGDLEAADVAGLLASLVDKSLVEAVIDREKMRYVLLDSTRAFARDQLAAASEGVALFRRHARWLVAQGSGAVREYLAEPNLVWLDEYWPEIDNVRAALDWATRSECHEDVVLAGEIAGNFRGLWLIPGMFPECRRWVELVLERIDELQQPSLVATLLQALTQTLTGSEMIATTDRLLTALRRLGDRSRLAIGLSGAAVRYCRSGLLLEAQQALDEQLEILAENGLLESPSHETLNLLLNVNVTRAELSLARGQFEEARAHFTEASVNAERIHDNFSMVTLSSLRAEIEFIAGNVALATEYSNAAVERAKAIPHGAALVASALCDNACIRLSTSDVNGADVAARYAFNVASDLGDPDLTFISLQNVAGVAARRGHQQASARLLGSIDTWSNTVGYHPRVFEEAARKLLLTALHEKLGADTEKYIAQGRRMKLELATNEALAIVEL